MDATILKKVQILSWLLAASMGLAAWFSFSDTMAKGVLIGGTIAASSFGFLQRDLRRLLSSPLSASKGRFFIKYYARLTLLAALLFWLVKSGQIQVFGLLLGLSAVLLSIAVVMAGEAKKLYFSAKEAS
ncbi:MAG: ATP synthase subunit I [Deltaproteobacteria bacterium]|jgi:hypothetical protein